MHIPWNSKQELFSKRQQEDFSVKTDTQVLAALAGISQLAPLVHAFRSGGIMSAPNEPIADGETVIGELNETEQSLYSACMALDAAADEIIAAGRSLLKSMSSEESGDNKHALELLKLNHETTTAFAGALSKMMWNGIKSRIGDKALKYNSLGLRADNKVVGSNSGSVDVHVHVIALGLG